MQTFCSFCTRRRFSPLSPASGERGWGEGVSVYLPKNIRFSHGILSPLTLPSPPAEAAILFGPGFAERSGKDINSERWLLMQRFWAEKRWREGESGVGAGAAGPVTAGVPRRSSGAYAGVGSTGDKFARCRSSSSRLAQPIR